MVAHQRINHNLMKILNLLHDGIYISDSSGMTLLVNEPYERLTGIAAADVMGKSVLELKESGVFSSVVNPEVVRTAETVTSVQEVNGRKVVLHGHPVLDEKGHVDLVVTFVRDITVFSRLKEEIASQKSMVDYYQKQVSTLNPEDVFLDDGMVAASSASKKILKSLENMVPHRCDHPDSGRDRSGKGRAGQTDPPPELEGRHPFFEDRLLGHSRDFGGV